METITAGEAVARVLRAEGVRHVFGLPGGHVLAIYNALYDAPGIDHILVRHEHAAASMAAASAQLTGEPSVCLVTAGPGATNLLTAIAEAYVGCLPIVILSGRATTATPHRGASQEIATERVFAPVTKWSVRVDRAEEIVDVIRQAFATARTDRPGPVLVDLPRDLLDADVPAIEYVPVGPRPRPPADEDEIAAAASALSSARRPVVIAGGGATARALPPSCGSWPSCSRFRYSRRSPDGARSPTTIRCRRAASASTGPGSRSGC